MNDRIRILFLASNPKNTKQLRLDEEVREIDTLLHQSKFRDRFDIKHAWAVKVNELQGKLLRYSPQIVHFSGHGSKANQLIFEDINGNARGLTAKALSDLFSILKDDIQLVVLNACYSEYQARAIGQHIESVIGMSNAVDDESAIVFAAALYQGLGYGRDILTAFRLACNAIELEGLDEQDTPKLISRSAEPSTIFLVTDGGELLKTPLKGVTKIYAEFPLYPQDSKQLSSSVSNLQVLSEEQQVELLTNLTELAFKEVTLWSTRYQDIFQSIIQLADKPKTMSFAVDAYRNIGLLNAYEGDFVKSTFHFKEAERLAREYCGPIDLARVLFTDAIARRFAGQFEQSRKRFVETLSVLGSLSEEDLASTGYLDLLCDMDIAFLYLNDFPAIGRRELENVIEKLENSSHQHALMSARFKLAVFDLVESNIQLARENIEISKSCADYSYQPNWVGNFELIEGLCCLLDQDPEAEDHFFHAYRNYRRIRFIQPLWISASLLHYWLLENNRSKEAAEVSKRYAMDQAYEFEKAGRPYNELLFNDTPEPNRLAKLLVQI